MTSTPTDNARAAAEIVEQLRDAYACSLGSHQDRKYLTDAADFIETYMPSPDTHAAKVAWPANAQFALGDMVQKKGRASWRGKVVGWYRTDLTALGYAVESEFEPGSVQIYPETGLLPYAPTPLPAVAEDDVDRVALAITQEIGWGAFDPFNPDDMRRIARAAHLAAIRQTALLGTREAK